MKIGIVCYPTYGGSGVVATELGKALALAGHQVHFITYTQPPRLDIFSENIFYHEVSVASYPLFEYLPYESALASKMVDVTVNEKLDLIHVHYAIPHASAAYLAKQILKYKGIHVPVITTLHGTDITLVGRDPSFEPVVTFSINESDGVTAVSESLKNDTYEEFEILSHIEVIPNFIDLNRFQKRPHEHFKKSLCPNGEKLLMHTSNFRKVKRIEDIVRVFALVRKKIPAKLVLIGDGPERSGIEALCRELEVQCDVRFLGKMDGIEEALSLADLFLLTSEKESFGLAALEAMACEVPVISSNAGGIPEVNIHGVTGYVSEIGDVKDMAANAIKMLSDPILHDQMKANALARAQEFDIVKILPLYEKYYERITSKSWKFPKQND
ncbi:MULTISPECIES: N-acetyl-alpha-D-glucosaminyl L-malate synthase BshA [Aquirufa]|jgi:N-acetyl-alpha-D-glucosaminyl L-malate synthase BshA|uniref:N-acetyl-alpha-D-glucosaminyl L-malate synthase BshA n=1 Tax=Aquirufa esocilacus TaxID=3096513 RepID=A0ABW6DMZ6_9BACT|nr:N-acetyl-alpha-D-glucosaminyl L-malate synthase BshA [Aquirufa antheringensis]MCE4217276.1 N-acetyl-alpha-D-glucosaminyl L-malate synthase BshA [Pseudarcicella sp. GAP-15]MCZ2478516.1 N-acetyl-alpha-D-glucosaminyl L-malate synthase BshA [Aquirufa antheringensis]MCZ2484527.1 N-acetyl-alpha-D-glucosaminyl L-malate synthase BshA [Aquirufa antheringensis]MCZ2487604.1 N-acetyl-alpha-D-glucosaminyl L-malate synthase BshA [Aquirufa antheringensis]MCZ2489571.1 N-acetyl-alpha-D-glucosaminyl L-malate